MFQNRLGLSASDYGGQSRRFGLLDRLHASEMLQQPARCSRAHAGDFQQFGRTVAHLAAFAMESYGEAVSFVANELNEMQYRRVVRAPTPGISSNSVERSRIWRRLRWKVTAKR